MSEEKVGFDVMEEEVLTDLDAVKESRSVIPASQGVRVKIEKINVRKSLENNAKDAAPEGPENRVAFKFLNVQFRIMDGVSVPVMDDLGNQTGETELKYKNMTLFTQKMDLVFSHNPEIKTSQWWKSKQYIFGFRQFCRALGIDTKGEIRINDEWLELLKGRELLCDIVQEEEQENKNGEWVGKGTFRNRVTNFKVWG